MLATRARTLPPARKRAAGALGVILALLFLAGCGAGGDEPAADARESPGDSETVVELESLDGSGTTGTVTFVPGGGGGSEVRLSLEGLPDPQGVYVGAVYRGTCSGETDEQGGRPDQHTTYRFVHGNEGAPDNEENVIQTLTSVAAGPDGEGSSVTPLPTPAEELLSGTPKYVDVHGEDEALACADLPVASV